MHLGAPGDDLWGTPGWHPTGRRGLEGGAPPWRVGPPLPHFSISFSQTLLSPEKINTSFLSLAFLLKNSRFFDLFAQPRFMSEIWHICSPVCDSSTYPSRILFG